MWVSKTFIQLISDGFDQASIHFSIAIRNLAFAAAYSVRLLSFIPMNYTSFV